ncbi:MULTISPECIES: KpsF/GutQ family sugar-phosphate isomerase [Achromobacter]|uniref:D-arabinose 5-phosphate isomerase n=1 Tax=Achromobacter spanius TaxID=217203 RepID=A0AAW3I692_9BURK|nr:MULTISPECIES: KpsF/GutQ family sugar-phosphate isomerase [Achromobacter]AZS82130.1 KpsF/GutQ family sugar-phosphate isomerase [Achromobacter spanius]KNE28415.1 D-arabinose 5-phosphate isomerase [Achromobacter spanius]MCD0496643.1 KpsF/GutQ family sugar-phosphate isomerase [Achromobacter sp. MY14]MCW3150909.1 KpsF/GutQ family sugar-phosphate isomerase [Achromobacter spanius]
MTDHPITSSDAALASARRTLQVESQGLLDLAARLDDSFTQAVALLLACQGRVVVTGIGKTGHIARKIAATFASTGTPAFFVHAAEAVHGDLGMITQDDVVIAVSYSGAGQELLTILPVARRMGAKLVAITGNPQSELALLADVHLDASVAQEACPLNLAPTASTTAALALGDALAVACLEARGFGPQDFARSHPGGALGRRLLTHVRDVMRQGNALPIVLAGTPVSQALEVMSDKGMGMTVVTDAQRRPLGIFTDGDLRRLIARHGDIRSLTVEAGMTRSPRSISPDALAAEAAQHMDELRLSQMLVLDADGALLGALHMHDLMAAKVV